MENEFTITVYSENHIGLLNQITIIFTRRHLNIESLTVSGSAIKGIHKFTIVVHTSLEKVGKVVKQIEKCIDVIKAFVYTEEEIIHQEIALYKVSTEALTTSNEIEKLVRTYNARILEVNPSYTVIEKTGHKNETQDLFDELDRFGVLQFVRSGRIAITKMKEELLTQYLKRLEKENGVLK